MNLTKALDLIQCVDIDLRSGVEQFSEEQLRACDLIDNFITGDRDTAVSAIPEWVLLKVDQIQEMRIWSKGIGDK